MFRGLLLHFDERCQSNRALSKNWKMWGEIFQYGMDVEVVEYALETILSELCSCTKYPILFIFDEVNFLWDANLQNEPYFRYAAHFNKIVLEHGWKLISGTGHSKFISAIPSGLQTYVKRFQPYSTQEFMQLLQSPSTCPQPLMDILTKKPEWSKIVCATLGNIPRQLSELAQLLLANPLKLSGRNLNQDFKSIITIYDDTAVAAFKDLNNAYFKSLDDHSKKLYLKTLIQVFIGETGVDVDPTFLDQSLIYYNSSIKKCIPINPAASKALLSNLRANYSFEQLDEDFQILMNPSLPNSTKGKPFENIILKKLLHAGKLTITHSKVDGTDEQTMVINCDHIAPILSGELLPNSVPLTPTLFAPQWEYPIADYIHVDPSVPRVTIIQISFCNASAKVPNILGKSNPYHAVYDSNHWHNITKDFTYNNYAELVLSLLGVPTTVQRNATTGILEEFDTNTGIQIPSRLCYLAITAKPIEGKNNNLKDIASQFPWARVVYKHHLAKIFSQQFVDNLESGVD